MTDPIIETIKNGGVLRFEITPKAEDVIQAILEAGRWAPSWKKTQTWRFIVVTDSMIKKSPSEFVPTIFNAVVSEAPVCDVLMLFSPKRVEIASACLWQSDQVDAYFRSSKNPSIFQWKTLHIKTFGQK